MEEPIVSLEKLLSHRQWVARVARALVSGADADDLAQSVWMRAITHPPRSDRGLRGWLATLLRRTARDTWRSESRRRSRERRVASSGAEPSAGEVVAEAETCRRMVNAVMVLPEPYRSTVLLRWFEDLGPTKIAALQGVPGFEVPLPPGAIYLYGRIGSGERETKDSAAVAESLLVETGVATVPGEAFGTPGFLRLNFSVEDEIFAEGADRIRAWFSSI